MGKAKARDRNAKRRDESDVQFRSRLARQRQNERDRNEPIVPKEAQAHGDYHTAFVTHAETNTKAHVVMNRGGCPVSRWKAAGRLSDTQVGAIDLCHHLWALAGLKTKMTANYGERIPGCGNSERFAINEIEARDDLHRIKGYVPAKYWDIYENVVRFDEPAGVAGSTLARNTRSGMDAAFVVVCFVADVIAMKEGL
ncbi:hypothetical protein [Croceicoccus sp. YJ47]|uniref:hypothetical protein n=1 Tax=Croceicoccus sp. YJ47 TaxID=2798724 RepID=UPI001924A5C5|nr:hypothetical protein [Croceicoccus sp. YJ47]QQN73942.1 hypothetical protein JD971_14525 [Croceicoccus sp. YJ47]